MQNIIVAGYYIYVFFAIWVCLFFRRGNFRLHEIFLAGSTQALNFFWFVASIQLCVLKEVCCSANRFLFFARMGWFPRKHWTLLMNSTNFQSQASNLFQIEITTIVLHLFHDSDFQKTWWSPIAVVVHRQICFCRIRN